MFFAPGKSVRRSLAPNRESWLSAFVFITRLTADCYSCHWQKSAEQHGLKIAFKEATVTSAMPSNLESNRWAIAEWHRLSKRFSWRFRADRQLGQSLSQSWISWVWLLLSRIVWWIRCSRYRESSNVIHVHTERRICRRVVRRDQ